MISINSLFQIGYSSTMFALFLFSVALVSALPRNRDYSYDDDCERSISLTSKGWTLTPSSYPKNTDCEYKFKVPKGSYAFIEINANNLKKGEYIEIENPQSVTVTSRNGGSNFEEAGSWPKDFTIEFKIKNAPVSINITVIQPNVKANIVKSYSTSTNSESIFLETDSWNEGQSYKFNSNGDGVHIAVATPDNLSDKDTHKWDNIFIYENGVFKKTLGQLAESDSAFTTKGEVILYMTKKVDIDKGAVLITDSSNIRGAVYSVAYLQEGRTHFTYKMTGVKEAVMTLVSSHKNPAKISVSSFSAPNGVAALSYNGGGPLQDHSSAAKINTAQLPVAVGGFANTFYLSPAEGQVEFAVLP